MGRVILTLPRLGETMEEAKVISWLVAPGAAFRRGEVLLEVETDKTVVEVPALAEGVLLAQLAAPGEMVALDQPIAEVEAEEAVAPAAATPRPVPLPDPITASRHALPGSRPAASPAARAAARRAGVELSLITGTGRRGRITAADVTAREGGATVVLLHGLFDDPRSWRDLPRRLMAAGHAVVAPALPGHGDAAGPADSLEAAEAALAHALPEGRLILVGHSLGAALAIRLAQLEGQRVERLLLLAPLGIGARINPDFIEGMLAAATPAALARALALLDGGPLSETALIHELERLRPLRETLAPLARALTRDGFQQIDVAEDLGHLACPVTVVFGTNDRILDWRDVANLPPQVAIHLIRGGGHLPHAAAPKLVARLIAGRAHALPEAAHG